MHRPALLTTAAILSGLGLFLSPATAAMAPGPEDPCAPVDGEVPVMCQSGVAPTADAPVADAPAAELPLTGRDDAAGIAATGTSLVLLGGAALVVARRRAAA